MALDSLERIDNGALDFFLDLGSPPSTFRDDVIAGLSGAEKSIPPKYFYDTPGARLFEAITRSADYYVPRAEAAAMRAAMPAIAELAGTDVVVIEPGAGAGEKVRALLDGLNRPYGAVLLDIAGEALRRSAMKLAADRPGQSFGAVAADFTALDRLPREALPPGRRRLLFFPGSTIGNFDPPEARALLCRFRAWLQPGDALLLGTDLVKDAAVLDLAYNDSAGVTAAFNRNLIARMNRELDAQLDTEAFEHVAFFSPARRRVEMHLRVTTDQVACIGEERLPLPAGTLIHTENSWKFDRDSVAELVASAGFAAGATWTDPDQRFLVTWCTAA